MKINSISFLDLIERIVEQREKCCTHELFLNRYIHEPKTNELMTPCQYLIHLSEIDRKKGNEYCNETFQHAYNKFMNMDETHSRKAINCIHTYKRMLIRIRKELSLHSELSQLEIEGKVQSTLCTFIGWQYNKSKLDILRKYCPYTRYSWAVHGGKIQLWMPRILRGRDRNKWLQLNISNPDPNRVGEADRIQRVIDSVPYTDFVRYVAEKRVFKTPKNGMTYPELLRLGQLKGYDVALANEKTSPSSFKQQRPKIQELGKKKLKQLILRIFHDLVEDKFIAKQVGAEYGLKAPTLSRFAGMGWMNKLDNGKRIIIPDLWNNLAQLLSHDEEFLNNLKDLNFWEQ
jgi:hypothetical protein